MNTLQTTYTTININMFVPTVHERFIHSRPISDFNLS